MTRLLTLPVELIRHTASFLSLDDVLSLQESDNELSSLLDNIYWRDFQELTAYCDQDGTYLTIASPSPSSSRSSCSIDIIPKLTRLRSIRVVCTAESSTTDQLIKALLHQKEFLRLQKFNLSMHAYEDDISSKTLYRFIEKVREFVVSQPSLRQLEVRTDFESRISMTLVDNCQAVLDYNQKPSLSTHTKVIYPLFHAFIEGRSLSCLSLFIHSLYSLDLSLQSAFHTALPHHMRSNLRLLRLDLGFDVQSIPFVQLCEMFSKLSPYLAMSKSLNQLIVNLPVIHFDSQINEQNMLNALERSILRDARADRIAFSAPRFDRSTTNFVRCK